MQIQCKISNSIVDVFVLLFCASVRCRMPGEIKKERARERRMEEREGEEEGERARTCTNDTNK